MSAHDVGVPSLSRPATGQENTNEEIEDGEAFLEYETANLNRDGAKFVKEDMTGVPPFRYGRAGFGVASVVDLPGCYDIYDIRGDIVDRLCGRVSGCCAEMSSYCDAEPVACAEQGAIIC
uniref:Uncharacterized protein n=1 Tax=Glossina pallidipes TaxID=7398 RepID=A0A1A9ZSP4_GLOPL